MPKATKENHNPANKLRGSRLYMYEFLLSSVQDWKSHCSSALLFFTAIRRAFLWRSLAPHYVPPATFTVGLLIPKSGDIKPPSPRTEHQVSQETGMYLPPSGWVKLDPGNSNRPITAWIHRCKSPARPARRYRFNVSQRRLQRARHRARRETGQSPPKQVMAPAPNAFAVAASEPPLPRYPNITPYCCSDAEDLGLRAFLFRPKLV